MNVLESVFKFFPPPALLKMSHTGISLSDDGIRIMRLQEKNNHRRLDTFSFDPLPAGVIKSGNVEKPAEVVAMLKKLKKQHALDFVAASIPDEKSYIFKTTIARQTDINLSNAVAFKIQETVPVGIRDAIFDFTIIATTPQNIDLVVRVVHQKVVSVYSDVLKSAGLRPILFKIESQAIADAILGPHDNDPHILIHIEATKTICMISENGAIIFSIVIDIGTDAFVDALKKAFKVDDQEARKIMRGEGTMASSHEDVFFTITNIVSVIRDQVIKLQEFWRAKEGEKSLGVLIVSGFPACLDGFAHYLESSTGIPSQTANVWTNAISVNVQVPPILFADALDYAPAIGLALPHKFHL